MNQKVLISVLVGVSVLILGSFYFLTAKKSVVPVVQAPAPVSKTVPATKKTNPTLPVVPVGQDKTANWKTYSNKTHGYSFQYPAGLLVREKTANNITIGSSAVPYLSVSVKNLTGDLVNFVRDLIVTEGQGVYKKEDVACVKKTILNRDSAECRYENQIGGYVGERIETFILGEKGNVFQIVAISGYIGMEQAEFQNKVVNSFIFNF